ncbi:MAG: ABC transporter permease, partial [Pseudomonadota bacterium]
MAAIDTITNEIETARPDVATLDEPAGISLTERGSEAFLLLTGTWSLRTLGVIWPKIAATIDGLKETQTFIVDASNITDFDISGAWAIRDIRDQARAKGCAAEVQASERLTAVFARMRQQDKDYVIAEPDEEEDAVVGALDVLGRKVASATRDVVHGLDLAGALMLWIVTAARRGGLRPRSIATHSIRMGIGAVPVVAISCFLVGGVIAQQSAYQLKDFGAETL